MSGNGDSNDQARRIPTVVRPRAEPVDYQAPGQGPLITYSARGIQIGTGNVSPGFPGAVLSWDKVMEMAGRFYRAVPPAEEP